MPVLKTSFAVLLSLSLAAGSTPAEEPMTWSPEALELNARGSDLSLAHDYQAAYDAYNAAYKAMPDPIRYHRARDWVFGSMRSSLISLYETTGEVKYLCQVREILLEHLEALILAFGEDAEIPDVPGIRRRLKEIEADMRAHVPKVGEMECVLRTIPREPASVPQRVAVRSAPDAPAKSGPSVQPPRARGLLAAGATSLALGSALLGVMAYALVARRRAYERLRELDATAEGMLDPTTYANANSLRRAGAVNLTAALVTGIAGGVLTLTGIGLIGASRHRGRRTAAAPVVSSGLTGLVIRTQF